MYPFIYRSSWFANGKFSDTTQPAVSAKGLGRFDGPAFIETLLRPLPLERQSLEVFKGLGRMWNTQHHNPK